MMLYCSTWYLLNNARPFDHGLSKFDSTHCRGQAKCQTLNLPNSRSATLPVFLSMGSTKDSWADMGTGQKLQKKLSQRGFPSSESVERTFKNTLWVLPVFKSNHTSPSHSVSSHSMLLRLPLQTFMVCK